MKCGARTTNEGNKRYVQTFRRNTSGGETRPPNTNADLAVLGCERSPE
jgi:hypothetical protein